MSAIYLDPATVNVTLQKLICIFDRIFRLMDWKITRNLHFCYISTRFFILYYNTVKMREEIQNNLNKDCWKISLTFQNYILLLCYLEFHLGQELLIIAGLSPVILQ